MITTKTSDRLMHRANELIAIADAVHEAGFKEECAELSSIASKLATISASIEQKLAAYAQKAMND